MSDVRIEDHTNEWLSQFDKQLAKALTAVGQEVERHAIENITSLGAVDTGRLRGSITHEVNTRDKYVIIGSNVEYAPYVELGTGKYYAGGRHEPWVYQDDKGNWHRTEGMQARPYLKPALQDNYSKLKKIFESEMKS